MKIQVSPSSVRIRVGESELGQLLEGECLRLAPRHAGHLLVDIEVAAAELASFSVDRRWVVRIARAELEAYAATLPRRDALLVQDGGGTRIEFEVDVRESIAVRGAVRRPIEPDSASS